MACDLRLLSTAKPRGLCICAMKATRGFSTRNPLYAGRRKRSLNITCRTASKISTCCLEYHLAEAIRGLEFFFEKAAMAPWLALVDDTLRRNV